MSTNKNERFVALNDIYGMHLKAQCYIYYARPKKKKKKDRKWLLNKKLTIQNFFFQQQKLTKNLILNV